LCVYVCVRVVWCGVCVCGVVCLCLCVCVWCGVCLCVYGKWGSDFHNICKDGQSSTPSHVRFVVCSIAQ